MRKAVSGPTGLCHRPHAPFWATLSSRGWLDPCSIGWPRRSRPFSEDAEWALQPKDWLRLRLVGRAGSEASDASGTLLFDLFQNTWAFPVIEALGIPARLLAPLGASDAIAGPLDSSIARELGLPGGIPVAFGAADTAAALVGTGLSEAGTVQLTVGSAAQVVTLRKLPRPDPQLRYHVFASAVPGLWYAMAAVQAAGVALSWALNAFNATWEEAYEVLDAARRGSTETPAFIPHLAGARSPSMNSSARAGFLGLELSHERADLLRAVFEGVAFSVAEAAGALPEFVDASDIYLAEAARFTGRGANSSVTCWGEGSLSSRTPTPLPRSCLARWTRSRDRWEARCIAPSHR